MPRYQIGIEGLILHTHARWEPFSPSFRA